MTVTGKNIWAQIFSEMLSDTNLILLCTTDLSPNELALKRAFAVLQSMESILEKEAEEGEQVLWNPNGKMQVCVKPFS